VITCASSVPMRGRSWTGLSRPFSLLRTASLPHQRKQSPWLSCLRSRRLLEVPKISYARSGRACIYGDMRARLMPTVDRLLLSGEDKKSQSSWNLCAHQRADKRLESSLYKPVLRYGKENRPPVLGLPSLLYREAWAVGLGQMIGGVSRGLRVIRISSKQSIPVRSGGILLSPGRGRDGAMQKTRYLGKQSARHTSGRSTRSCSRLALVSWLLLWLEAAKGENNVADGAVEHYALIPAHDLVGVMPPAFLGHGKAMFLDELIGFFFPFLVGLHFHVRLPRLYERHYI
jgi:hypothetical protein